MIRWLDELVCGIADTLAGAIYNHPWIGLGAVFVPYIVLALLWAF